MKHCATTIWQKWQGVKNKFSTSFPNYHQFQLPNLDSAHHRIPPDSQAMTLATIIKQTHEH
jgi:hypothetical protein